MGNKYSSVVLYSGGIDSYILLKYVRQMIDPDTKPVFFDIGAKYGGIETIFVGNYCIGEIVDNTLKLGDMETDTAFIPNRNILLATLAVARYSNTVYIGGSKSDRISDNNQKVFDDLSQILTATDTKNVVTITSPFWDMYKDDMVKWYASTVKDGRIDLLQKTFSCYTPLSENRTVEYLHSGAEDKYTSRHCFTCPACFRRNAALSNVDIYLPFDNEKIVEKYLREFDSTIKLDPNDKRADQSFKYINRLGYLSVKSIKE